MKTKKEINYRGWKITFNENRPVTGVYVAERWGVMVNNSTLEGVKNLVDSRIKQYPESNGA
jgi:hypothetical protein